MTTKPPVELAVVVPTFNEAENVGELVTRLHDVLAGLEHEIVVVDDDSPDGTALVVRRLCQSDSRLRLIHRIGRRGLSSACIEGMLATTAPRVVVIDADLQHDERLIPAMLGKAKDDELDLVIASRHSEGGSNAGLVGWRRGLSDAGRRLSRLVTRAELTDPMSGFFLVDRRFLDEVVRSLAGSGFKILLDLVASSKRPVRFAEVSYHFRARTRGESKLDALVGVEYLQLLVDKLLGGLLPPRFVLFATVGATGVALHLGILGAALRTGLGFARAQLAATIIVMTTNFVLNNVVTWREYRLRGWAAVTGLLKFYLACSIGALLNLQLASFAVERGAPWYVAGLAGLIVGSVWNYAVNSTMTWNRRRRAATREA